MKPTLAPKSEPDPPPPERLKIHGNWMDAVRKALTKKPDQPARHKRGK